MRRRAALVAALALGVGLLPLPAFARSTPELLTQQLPAVVAGGSSWVALNWQGTGDVGDVRVTARAVGQGRQVVVEYPENTADHSSLMQDAELATDEIDFTALKLTVPYGQARQLRLQIQLSYTEGGRTHNRNFMVTVPVIQHTGADLEVVTDTLGPVASPTGGWVEVLLSGVAPTLSEVQVTVEGAVAVTYPAEGSSTSLHHDATLVAGETDVARFLVDPEAPPGSHQLTVTISYAKGSERLARTVTLGLEVTEG